MAASGGTKPASPNLMTAYVILQDHPLSAGGRARISRSSRRMQPPVQRGYATALS
jgi:hypothetical protein